MHIYKFSKNFVSEIAYLRFMGQVIEVKEWTSVVAFRI